MQVYSDVNSAGLFPGQLCMALGLLPRKCPEKGSVHVALLSLDYTL